MLGGFFFGFVIGMLPAVFHWLEKVCLDGEVEDICERPEGYWAQVFQVSIRDDISHKQSFFFIIWLMLWTPHYSLFNIDARARRAYTYAIGFSGMEGCADDLLA